MMRLLLRTCVLVTFLTVLVLSGFANSPAKASKTNDDKKDDETAVSSPSETKSDDTATPEAAPANAATVSSPAEQSADKKADKKNSGSSEDRPAPRFTPMLATTGTIGLFTVETAATLPKGGFAFSAYGNKFERMPGSVSIFQLGVDFSYGITDRLNFYGGLQAYQHAHIGCGPQLSLAPPNNGGPLYQNTIFHTLIADRLCDSVTPTAPFSPTPGYVEDYPFAANNGGGIGNVIVGLKYGILSERLGDPISLSVRNDVIISTRTRLSGLLANGTQGSPLSDMVSIALSKQWSNVVIATFNTGFMFVRNPRDNGQILFGMADQFRSG